MNNTNEASNKTIFAANPALRGFLAALFTAGFTILALSITQWAPMDNLPFIFFTILLWGFVGSQFQERMRGSD